MEPIVTLAANARPGEKKFVLFVGAGVSKDAGVPTSWDLMLKTAGLLYFGNGGTNENIDLEEWFNNSKYSQMTFSELMESLYNTYPAQQDFLKNYLSGYEVGDAHKSIAELARRGIIRCIVTTNFDHYLEKALEEKGIDVQVISNEEDLKHSEPLIHCKSVRIYKTNGDLGRGALKNTPKDLEQFSTLWKDELVKVFSEHGVMVLGYSGMDKNIQDVFKQVSFDRYPLYWINPSAPKSIIENILKQKNYTYIPCQGANQFITDYLRILNSLDTLSPGIISGPTILEIKNALNSPNSATHLFTDFLNGKYIELKNMLPDFTKFEEYDDAIVDQINNGKFVSYNFLETILLACKYGDEESIRIIYEFFGKFLNLYETQDPDGYSFLVYEFFVSFFAGLIKYNQWDLIDGLLSKELFVEESYEKYISFVEISRYSRILDKIRNQRLNSNRVSITADILYERFTQTDLSNLISHKEFMEADYFLFMRSLCQNLEYSWNPQSCLYLEKTPTYIEMAISNAFLDKLSKATGFEDSKKFIQTFATKQNEFRQYFREAPFKRNPLSFFEFKKLGTKK